ncbi:hypothetical protein DPMN_099352, partial [Dreissena polymorpha]
AIPFDLHEPAHKSFPGLKPVAEWRAYQIQNCEGFIVISNAFKRKYQRYWVARCLLDFPMKPNKTNVDAHTDRPSQIWNSCIDNNRPDLKKDSLLMRLRWATLGYQYEWNTKEYFSDRVQEFPTDLSHLCGYIAETLGYSSYSSEAGIVNFYRMDSSLMGHTDVSELDHAAPIISFSFGQSCIFLIGGPTKATTPTAVFLHSGDIVLMTKQARLSYHAVPRILPGNPEHLHNCFYGDDDVIITESQGDKSIQQYVESSGDSNEIDPYSDTANQKPPHINIVQSDSASHKEDVVETPTMKGNNCSVDELGVIMDEVLQGLDWAPFHEYLNVSRVNVNVRQVLKAGAELGLSLAEIKPCDRNYTQK